MICREINYGENVFKNVLFLLLKPILTKNDKRRPIEPINEKEEIFKNAENFYNYYKRKNFLKSNFYDNTRRAIIARFIVLSRLYVEQYKQEDGSQRFPEIVEKIKNINLNKIIENKDINENSEILIYLAALNDAFENMLLNIYPNKNPEYLKTFFDLINEISKI